MEEIRYNHWKTGEERLEPLEKNGVLRTITAVICPFDNTPILYGSDEKCFYYECPNCQTIYHLPKKHSQKHVDQQAREKAEIMKRNIASLDSKKADLLRMIELATENQLFTGKPQKVGIGTTPGTAD